MSINTTELHLINESDTHRVSHYKLFNFLYLSFPSFTTKQYRKINAGKRFLKWIWMENEKKEILACVALFKRVNKFKLGLFCVNREKRRQKIGSQLFTYIREKYNPLEWTAKTLISIAFYTHLGATKQGIYQGRDGVYYTLFTYNTQVHSP